MNGIYIKELKLSGLKKKSASIKFKKGANLVSGPSNTGKTFIFECIEYMLGASSLDRRIKESREYQEIYLELSNYDDEIFTLKSDFEGGDFYLYKEPLAEIRSSSQYELIKRTHSPNQTNTLSYVLLDKCGLAGLKVRVNAKGKVRDLSLRDIRILHLVDEIRVITKGSPFLTGQHLSKTVEENVMKLLLSGIDDSGIVENIPEKVLANKSGRLELLTELIGAAKACLLDVPNETELKAQAENLVNSMKLQKENRLRLFDKYQSTSLIKEELLSKIRVVKGRLKDLTHLYENSAVLEKQYYSDMNRLRATIETSSSINSIEKSNCPLCKTEYQDDSFASIDIIRLSAKSELLKIDELLGELLKAKQSFLNEIDKLEVENKILVDEITGLTGQLEQGLKKELDEVILLLDKIKDEISENEKYQNEYKALDSLKKQKKGIENIIEKAPPQKRNFEIVNVSMLGELLNDIELLLNAWGYPEVGNVSYSEINKDLIISKENRNLAGKGYRALTYASFILSLNTFNRSRERRLGFCIIDSPLVTYKKPDVAKGEGISEDMANEFYRSLVNIGEESQVIIIENEELPSDAENKFHHIHFTKNKDLDRYGFIPLMVNK